MTSSDTARHHLHFLRSIGTLLPWAAATWLLVVVTDVYLLNAGQRSYRVETASWILLIVLVPQLLRRPASSDVPPAAIGSAGLWLAAIGTFWLLAAAPIASVPFLSDDYVFLAWADGSGDVLRGSAFFRPLFALVFRQLARIAESPALFHLVSGALHLGCGALVFVLARRLFGRAEPAVLSCALFVLSPLQLEAVAWVSGLQELLWTFFVLLAVCVYTRPASPVSLGRALAVAGIAMLGLLSKETAICFVLLLALADVSRGRARQPRILRNYVVFGGVIALYLIVRSRFAAIEDGFFFWPSRYFAKELVARPYRVFTQPWNAAAVDVPDAVAWAIAASFVLLVVAAVVARRGDRRLWLGPAIVLISILPLGAYFFVGSDLSSSRYLYFATIGWGVLVGDLLLRVATSQAACRLSLVIVMAASATLLHLNVRPWTAAGELVDAMRQAVVAGTDVNQAIDSWRRSHPGNLDLKDDVPVTYNGVYVFLNGYEEFRRGLARTASAP